MTMYLTRVELHDADEEKDYRILHEAMEKQGFARTITADKGGEYRLPRAEYYRESPLSPKEIRDQALTAAKTTGRRCGVIVAKTDYLTWIGLDTVLNEPDSKGHAT